MAPKPMVYGVDYGPGSSRKQGTSATTTPAAAKPVNPFQQVIDQANQWNTRANNMATASQNYAQNNPFTQQATDYNADTLSGDTSNNPFMSDLQHTLAGSNQNESMDYLRQFLGPNNGGQSSGPGYGANAGGGVTMPNGQVISGLTFNSSGGTVGGGPVAVPDTVGGQNTFFAKQIQALFDPSRLDPSKDPTMQPYLDMLTRKSNEALQGQLADVSARAEGSGMYGSGTYQALDRNARSMSQQNLDDSITQALMGARTEALNNQMSGLGLTNTRDIAAMNDATQRYGIATGAATSGAGIAAQAADAAAGRRLQAIQDMMQGSQYNMGLENDLAGTLAGNQTSALNSGIGYGQLGQSGFNTAINAGNLGLSGLGLEGQIAQANRQYQNQLNNQAFNRKLQTGQAEQNSLDSYLNLLMGIGNMGGAGYGTTQQPGQYIPSTNPLMNGLLGLMSGYNNSGS